MSGKVQEGDTGVVIAVEDFHTKAKSRSAPAEEPTRRPRRCEMKETQRQIINTFIEKVRAMGAEVETIDPGEGLPDWKISFLPYSRA